MKKALPILVTVAALQTSALQAQVPEIYTCEGAYAEQPDGAEGEVMNAVISIVGQQIHLDEAMDFTGTYDRKPSDLPSVAFSDGALPTVLAGVFNTETGFLEMYKYGNAVEAPNASRRMIMFADCKSGTSN